MKKKKQKRTYSITRYGLVAPGWAPDTTILVSGKDQPGPITFSSESEAEAEIRFRNHWPGTYRVVKVKISFSI